MLSSVSSFVVWLVLVLVIRSCYLTQAILRLLICLLSFHVRIISMHENAYLQIISPNVLQHGRIGWYLKKQVESNLNTSNTQKNCKSLRYRYSNCSDLFITLIHVLKSHTINCKYINTECVDKNKYIFNTTIHFVNYNNWSVLHIFITWFPLFVLNFWHIFHKFLSWNISTTI